MTKKTEPWSDWDAESAGFECEAGVGLTVQDYIKGVKPRIALVLLVGDYRVSSLARPEDQGCRKCRVKSQPPPVRLDRRVDQMPKETKIAGHEWYIHPDELVKKCDRCWFLEYDPAGWRDLYRRPVPRSAMVADAVECSGHPAPWQMGQAPIPEDIKRSQREFVQLFQMAGSAEALVEVAIDRKRRAIEILREIRASSPADCGVQNVKGLRVRYIMGGIVLGLVPGIIIGTVIGVVVAATICAHNGGCYP